MPKTNPITRPKIFWPQIFLVSFGLLLLEISYTRVFSFKVSSYFTYVIIGFALLGIGAGGVIVALLPRLRTTRPAHLLARLCFVAALTTVAGYFVVAGVELSTQELPPSLVDLARLGLVCGALFATFCAAGLVVAILFAARPDAIARLYAADLAGAGLGCAAAVPMMTAVSPPGCIFFSGAAFALAAVCFGVSDRRWSTVLAGAAVGLGIGVVVLHADRLPDPIVDPLKSLSSENMARWELRHVLRRWHPVFRVDVVETPRLPDRKGLIHDGMGGSALYRYDGDERSLGWLDSSSRILPFAVVASKPRVLVIGAAGGAEILASLRAEATEIVAVELNPVTVSLLKKEFADFTGRIVEDERVRLVNGEGRSFLGRDPSQYDLIYFAAPDSYAAMSAAQASGFILVESYLYTSEMVHEALNHLRPGGVVAMQFGEFDYDRKANRTARYLATARKAFAESGIDAFSAHVLLATTDDFPISSSTILLRPGGFDRTLIDRFAEAAERVPNTLVLHAGTTSNGRGAPNQVIGLPEQELERFYAEGPYEISPVSDDNPFFWHFTRFSDLLFRGSLLRKRVVDPEDGMGEVTLLVTLVVMVVFAGTFLFLPFVFVRQRWRQLPHKLRGAGYFAALGLGFMFFEIAALQKLTLFLGYPTYSLTVTLFSLLVLAGVGSLIAERYASPRGAVRALVGVLFLLTLFFQFGLDLLMSAFVGGAIWVRVLWALLVLAPLGLSLGAFMPLGLRSVSRLTACGAQYVAWAWGVNGFFSVIGSIVATMISMSYGFRVLLSLAFLLYVLAAISFPDVGAERRTAPHP